MGRSSETLFEIAEDFERLQEMLEESGGELTAEMEAVWDSIPGRLRQKAEAYLRYIRTQEDLAETCARRQQRYAARKRVYSNRIAAVRELLRIGMARLDAQKVETVEGTVYRSISPSFSLRLAEGQEPPEEYRKAPVLDLAAFKAAYREQLKDLPDGEHEVGGVRVVIARKGETLKIRG